jgi:NitT/TauT family transport system substrate-binding protein
LLLALAILSSNGSRAADLQKVRVSIIPSLDAAPLFSAIHNGYFRDVGLEIDPSPSAGGAVGIPGLLGGSFDIVYGNVVSTLLANEQGLDIRVVAPGTVVGNASTDTTPLIVRGDGSIKSGKDLEGKIVAVNTRNNVIWLYVRAWIIANGGDPDLVTYKEVPFPLMDDALQKGLVDAAFLPAPFSVIALNKGRLILGKPFSDVQLGVNVGQYVTTQKIIATKPEMVEKFVAALRRGAEWFNANRKSDLLLKIIAGYSKTDDSLLKLLPEFQPAPLRIDVDQVKKTMTLMIEQKLLREPIDLSAAIAKSAL